MHLEKIKRIPHIDALKRIAKKKKIYVWLVGGFLRDLYLGRKNNFDFDFVTDRDSYKLASAFSKKVGARLIMLDKKERTFRVVVKRDTQDYSYDFSPFKGSNLEEDIKNRDFTINTLAVLVNILPEIKIFDYVEAKKDLKRKILRVTQEKVIPSDPLRILRAFSLSAKYGFRIEKKTLKILSLYRSLLKNIAGERIAEELFKILDSPSSYKVIKLMSQYFIIDEVIPHLSCMRDIRQGRFHHLDVWEHSLKTLNCFEILWQRRLRKNRKIQKYLKEELASQRKRLSILKLACLLHDIGKPKARKIKNNKTIFYTHEKIGHHLCEDIAVRLKLSWKEKETLKKLVFWHMRPGSLIQNGVPTKRAIFRFFRDTEPEGLSVIFLSIADWRATKGELVDEKRRMREEKVLFRIIKEHLERKKQKFLPKLVDGYEIMERFKITPSPLVGKILKRIKEEQSLGRIKTKREAFQIAEKVLRKERNGT
ncbi:MAG: hypothetical protein DRP76_01510 [Candidatus Omnitrophota bacterium]|nr:MAG: hypothetical protein DRP76_01510 [Candidatus Omnitrophota bacterium]